MKTFLSSAAIVLLCCGAQAPSAPCGSSVNLSSARLGDEGLLAVRASADATRLSACIAGLIVLQGSVALLSL